MDSGNPKPSELPRDRELSWSHSGPSWRISMATIRKHRDKWQVRIRRAGLRPMAKSFAVRKDAMEWGRQMEVRADRAELPTDPKALERVTLGDLVRRYRDTVSQRKKTAA